MTTKYPTQVKILASLLILVIGPNSAKSNAGEELRQARAPSHLSFAWLASPSAPFQAPTLNALPALGMPASFEPRAEIPEPAAPSGTVAEIAKPELPRIPESNRFASIGSVLRKIGTAVHGTSLQAFYDSGNKESATDAAPTLAQGIVHETPKPLKLHWGVEKVAPSLRVPKNSGVARRHFQGPHLAAAALDADPNDPKDVERAIRALFKSQPKKFGLADDEGNPVVDPEDLALVHVMPVHGSPGQADTIHAVFRQVHKGIQEDGRPYYLQVYGASLSLTFKVFNGKPVLMGYAGRLYPVKVDMTPKFSNGILQSVADQRLMPVTTSGRVFGKLRSVPKRTPEFLARRIIPDDEGNWHAANIYQGADLNGQPINIAVDVATGRAFAWDARGRVLHAKRAERPASSPPAAVEVHWLQTPLSDEDSSAASITVLGRGNTMPRGNDHGPIDAMPMPSLKIRDSQGNLLGVTDEQGRLDLPDGRSLEVTAGLDGEYATVDDADKKNLPLKIVVKLAAGHETRAVLNPVSDDAEFAGQIDSYLGWNLLLRWMKSLGINDKRVDEPLMIVNNKSDMPCNAYYDPISDTLNLERESEDCENSAQPSVLLHESGHRFVQFFARIDEGYLRARAQRPGFSDDAFDPLRHDISSIMGGGVNEGTADTISMYFRDNPKIGEKFFKYPGPDRPLVLRDGRNQTQYRPGEVHDEGEAFMGATWEIYEGFKALLGDAAGAAYASATVVPALIFSQPIDVEAAIEQILLAVARNDGGSPYAEVVRRAAQNHGIPVS